jgi:tetratricopeptide (TPR) repeat protein
VECLELLLAAAGQVVTKEELQDKLWPGRVVEESNLAQTVSALRKVLGPDSIETAVGIGYRLTVAPTQVAPAQVSPALRRRFPVAAMASLLVFLAAAAWGFSRWSEHAVRRDKADRLYEEAKSLVRAGNFAKGMKAGELFEQAIALVPDHALAYAGMAEAAARYGKGSSNSAGALAKKSVSLDPNCGECQAVLGYVMLTREHNWPDAGQALDRALAIDPSPSQWRLWKAQWLATQLRFSEAKNLLRRAINDDPSKSNLYVMLAGVHYFAGETKDAIVAAEHAIANNPGSTAAFQWLYRIHWVAGNYGDAVLNRVLENVRWGAGGTEMEQAERDEYTGLFKKKGLAAICGRWLSTFANGGPADVARCERAIWLLALGRKDDALTELEAALVSKPFNIIYLAADPAFKPLHSEPRFQAVLTKLGLPRPTP